MQNLPETEDLNHTGAHKINNAIGQVLLARRMDKKRIIAETGPDSTGGHGYGMCPDGNGMRGLHGKTDVERQRVNVGAHADAGSQSGSRDFGQHDPEGCYQRSHTRLVLPSGGHILCDWFHSGASSLPRHGSPLAVGHQ